MSAPLVFVRDGRTLPFVPVTMASQDAIRSHIPKRRPYAVATYMALLEFANENRADRVAVSQRELIERVGASRSTVQSALVDLQGAGVLQVHERRHAGARIENEYVLVEPSLTTADGDAPPPATNQGSPVTKATVARDKGDGRPSGKQLTQEEKNKEEGNRGCAGEAARKRYDLPADFPQELRPHLIAVYRTLKEFAERHGAQEVNPVSLVYVLMANPRKALVAAATDYCSWWETKNPKDVVQGYKYNVINRAPTLASLERLDQHGVPTDALPPGVTPLHGRRQSAAERAAAGRDYRTRYLMNMAGMDPDAAVAQPPVPPARPQLDKGASS